MSNIPLERQANAANQATEISSLSSIDSKTPALVSGRQPVDGSGVIQPVSQSGSWTVQPGNTANTSPWLTSTRFSDTANLDAFSRLRTSQVETLFDSKQLVDNQPLFWDDQNTSGTGTTSTYLTNQSASQLSVANLTAGTRVRQTFQRFNYQSGKSMLGAYTGVLGVGETGITRRVGSFDAQNGVFFQLSGTTLSIVIRSFVTGSAVDTVITQANWNLDRLNGSGTVNPSGLTLDTSKSQIMVIDFQWLGVGRVRFGFDIGGTIIYCHQVLNANILSTVWTSIPNLPVRYEISNDGTGPAANLIQICSSIMVEGGRHQLGTVLSVDRGATAFAAAAGTSLYPVIAMRLKSNYQMASIQELLLSITCASNATYRWCLLLNPTVAGTALSFTSVTNSAIEAQTNTTNATTVSGGTQLISGYVDATTTQGVFVAEVPSDLRLGASIAGVSDILVLAVQTVVGAAENYFCSLVWREQI